MPGFATFPDRQNSFGPVEPSQVEALHRVEFGQDVRVTVEGDSTLYSGRIARVSPAIDEQSRSLRIEAEVGNERNTIRPGSFATTDIIVAAENARFALPEVRVGLAALGGGVHRLPRTIGPKRRRFARHSATYR